jgi:hypothetical protein
MLRLDSRNGADSAAAPYAGTEGRRGPLPAEMSGVRRRLGILGLVVLCTLGITDESKPPCVRATVALEQDIDSGKALPNDPFRFVSVGPLRLADGTVVPEGTIGYGVVAISKHADRGGKGGYLVLETRFLSLPGGAHVPVSIDFRTADRAAVTGASMNIPGFFGAIPFAGYFLGPYGFIHHGKDVIVPRGSQIPVIVGDDVATGACRVVPPTPEPSAHAPAPASPAATAEPSAPATTPVPAPEPTATPQATATPEPSATPETNATPG